ncbi:NLR family CARD domain-containing protein 4 [Holothuria leucospilota]|uniref:NLR family CARD domain-containing protein 4 n=1 Tax=Holothuria leucospilota TaxID=206669 RepID=A0A9Q1CSQ9_HOLLE|nr:NLR family CARD domain-containing protein 4 [Holothuria leucospilota]
MPGPGSDSCQELTYRPEVKDVCQANEPGRSINPQGEESGKELSDITKAESVIEQVQTAVSQLSTKGSSIFLQGNGCYVFSGCSITGATAQDEKGKIVEGRDKSTQTRPYPKYNFGFTNFQRELCTHLNSAKWWYYDKRLLEKLTFSSAETAGVLNPWNEVRFVRLLREKGIISSSNITQFTSAITSVNHPSTLVTEIQELFEMNLDFWLNVPPSLKDKIEHLVEGLKSQYNQRHLSILPIPEDQGDWRSVNDVFVETNIERFIQAKWEKVSSHHEITNLLPESRPVVILSEPGYGKSMLLQQFAYEWYSASPDSPLQYVPLFILIRLKELQGVKCIYDAIKTLLPLETILTSSDIRDILTSGEVYVVFAFDGFDEYPDADVGDNDINSVISGKMFSSFGVVVTTRLSRLHNLQQTAVTKFRLTGFEVRMQETYLEKVFAAATKTKQKIMSRIQESDILMALCQGPFFFAIISPILIRTISRPTKNANSVTEYFDQVITNLFAHTKRKVKRDSPTPAMFNEEPQHRLCLARIAYNGLINTPSKISWSEEDILRQLGSFCYDLYVGTGVLRKEQGPVYHPGSHVAGHLSNQTSVSFFHTTIQEYFAATYLVGMSKKISQTDFKHGLQKIHAQNFPYLCQFVCGLDSTAAKLVMDYLLSREKDERMLAILCVLEHKGEGIDRVITELCNTEIDFSPYESILLQRAKMQLLQTASNLQIPISGVCLRNCLMSSNVLDESLYLFSGLSVPILDTIRELRIVSFADLRNQTVNIIHFALKCETLRKLTFDMELCPRTAFSEDVLERIRRQSCEG